MYAAYTIAFHVAGLPMVVIYDDISGAGDVFWMLARLGGAMGAGFAGYMIFEKLSRRDRNGGSDGDDDGDNDGDNDGPDIKRPLPNEAYGA